MRLTGGARCEETGWRWFGMDGQGGRGEQVADGALFGGIAVMPVVAGVLIVLITMAVLVVIAVMAAVACLPAARVPGCRPGKALERTLGQSARADLQRKSRARCRRHESGRYRGAQQQRGCESEEDDWPALLAHMPIIGRIDGRRAFRPDTAFAGRSGFSRDR